MTPCRDLHKQPDDVEVMKGASMEIPDGIFLDLLGPNGTGKTILIRMTTGLLPPNTGTAAFDGQAMDQSAVAVKQTIGVTNQHASLDKELIVGENMELAGRSYRMGKADIAASADRLLSFLGLNSVRKRVVQNLSGGTKRKLTIAKSLVYSPKYLSLDEPMIGTDPNACRDIWDFLYMQHREEKTIFLITYYVEEVQHLYDYVIFIDRGKIFKEGTPKGLVDEIGPFKVKYEDGDRMKDEFFQDLPAAKARVGGIDTLCNILPSTLEDVFFYYANKGVGGWK